MKTNIDARPIYLTKTNHIKGHFTIVFLALQTLRYMMYKLYAAEGNKEAELALDVFCYRVAKYVGSYVAAMNGVDAITFTGGIGENAGLVRGKVLSYLGYLGIKMDEKMNEKRGENFVLSTADSAVKVAVIPTNEELAICRETVELVK